MYQKFGVLCALLLAPAEDWGTLCTLFGAFGPLFGSRSWQTKHTQFSVKIGPIGQNRSNWSKQVKQVKYVKKGKKKVKLGQNRSKQVKQVKICQNKSKLVKIGQNRSKQVKQVNVFALPQIFYINGVCPGMCILGPPPQFCPTLKYRQFCILYQGGRGGSIKAHLRTFALNSNIVNFPKLSLSFREAAVVTPTNLYILVTTTSNYPQ